VFVEWGPCFLYICLEVDGSVLLPYAGDKVDESKKEFAFALKIFYDYRNEVLFYNFLLLFCSVGHSLPRVIGPKPITVVGGCCCGLSLRTTP
jgi:hypothetical protein